MEFPPLSTDLMESPDCSAEQVSKANVRLAIDLATKFVLEQGLKVVIESVSFSLGLKMVATCRPNDLESLRSLVFSTL